MAIQAIGAQPQVTQLPAYRSRDDAAADEVQSGNVNGVPTVEETGAGGRDDAGNATDRGSSTSLSQALHELDRSVRRKLQDAVGDQAYDVRTDTDVLALETELRRTLAEENGAVEAGDKTDFIAQAHTMQETLIEFTSSLMVTLESLLPPVPFEAEIPPDPQQGSGQPQPAGPEGVNIFA